MPKVHFIGIGGIGASSLARWFLAQKWAISGSDLVKSSITLELRKEGVKVKIGHKKGNINGKIDLIIYSRAVKPENPEFIEAKRLKIPLFSYPEIVGKLTDKYVTIAIAGAHGKSTTTVLLGLILENAGLDPTVIVGTKLKEFGGKNFRNGESPYLVLEADEYGGAFLNYFPTLAVVLNIDKEHMDFYGNLGAVKKSYLKFISRIARGGILILNRDDKNIRSLKNKIGKIAAARHIKIVWFSLRDPEAKKIKKIIRIPGIHNVSDFTAAAAAARMFKISLPTVLKTIGNYGGSWRRMEYRGKLKLEIGNCPPEADPPLAEKLEIPVYDDYAHHPTEIKATLRGLKEKFPDKKIVCVFQPHQAERLRLLFRDFQSSFNDADMTLIFPLYKVAGRDKINPKFDSKALVKAIQKKYPKKLLFYLSDPKNLKNAIATLLSPRLPALPCPKKSKIVSPNWQSPRLSALAPYTACCYMGSSPRSSAIIIMMGAGDIVNYTKLLLSKN